jgi:glycerophosphoryl diester phosphodiesterase
MKPLSRLFWLTAVGFTVVCAAALYATGQIIQSEQYFLGNPWLTTTIFFAFWFSAILIAEYIALLFVPLKWSAKKARAGLLALEMLGIVGLLIYARFQWTTETLIGKDFIDYPEVWQLFFAALITAFLARVIFFQHHDESVSTTVIQKNNFVWFFVGLCSVLLLAGFYMNYSNGKNTDLQNDEFLQYSGAVGYLRTGEFVLWDFRTDAIKRDPSDVIVPYERAEVSTWQIAQSMKLFGETEWAARLPAQIWFGLFLFTVYIAAFLFSRSVGFAILVTASFIFFDGFLMHARFVRMYSPLLTLSTWVTIVFWYTYGWFVRGEWLKWFGGVVLTIALFLFGWLNHELILILAPAMIAFIVVEWLRGTVKKSPGQRYRTVFLILCVLAAIGLWFLNDYLDSRIFTLGHLGLRDTIGYQYQFLPFMDLALPLVAMAVYCLAVVYGVVSHKARSVERYLAVVSFTVIFLFIVVARRYSAYRYVQLISPLCIALVWIVWYRYLSGLLYVIGNAFAAGATQRFVPLISAVTFFVLFVPFSIPGVTARLPWLTQSVEQARTYGYETGFHTSAAYNFIREQKKPTDPVFAMVFRDVYWKNDPRLQLVKIPRDRQYKKNVLEADLARFQGQDIWFVWDAEKNLEIPEPTRRLIVQQGVNLSECTPELRASNMHLYYFGQRDIPCDPLPAHTSADWTNDHRVVAHGMGNVGDDIRTNSKEAFEESIAEGTKVIEADFVITKDNRLVVKHDWLVDPGNGKSSVQRPQLYRDFMNSRIDGKYTPLDSRQLLEMLEQHPDVFLVIDVKGKDYNTVVSLLQKDIRAVNPALFKQIILQTYHPEDVAAAKRFSDQSHILFTVYRTTLSDPEILTFINKERISVITIPKERYSDELAAALRTMSVRVYLHTVNDVDQAKRFIEKGAYGVYSDTLITNDLSEKQ